MARSVLNATSASENKKDLSTMHMRSLWSDAMRRLLKNRGAAVGGVIFLLIIVVAIIAPVIAPYNPIKLHVSDSLQSPSGRHWLGTDQFGRDTLSRIIYGSRVSVAMGLVAVAISVVGGSVLGLISGYFRGVTDMLVSRLVDVMLGFPGILLALVVIAVLGTNLRSAMIAVGVSGMPIFIRVVRGSTLSAREYQYVEAARVVGCGNFRILFRHVMPNVSAPVIVLSTLGIPSAIIAGAALSFLGLGIKPPTADWGEMLSNGRSFMSAAWWLSTFPGLALMVMVMAINLFGDGLRDALDPRMKV
ncbi:MAG TPA: ABC transporter permease [Nitrolancea sp.]|nr:ABC transporter permease [Nitrolancea sp.]